MSERSLSPPAGSAEPRAGEAAVVERWHRRAMLGRLLACLATTLVLVWSAPWPLVAPIVGVLAVESLLALPYYLVVRRRPELAARVYQLALLENVLGATLCLYLLGGQNAVFGTSTYAIIVLAGAMLVSARWSLLIAAVASASYGLMVLAVVSGAIPARPGAIPVPFAESWPWLSTAVTTAVLISLALIAGMLSNHMRRETRRARALAAALEAANRDLERRVEAAVAGFMSKAREVELYARAVSHDLRSPLAAAGEAVRLLAADPEQPRRRALDLARENLDRADGMLEGLRTLMRTVGAEEAVEDVDLTVLVLDVVRELEAAHVGRSLPVSLEGDLGRASGQRVKLAHVVRNLVMNALVHGAPEDGAADAAAAFEVRIGRRDGAGETALFVRDNGRGIPFDYQAKLFDPFRRGPGQGPGLGLGLALVSQIAAAHGGRAWVESRPGEGACFWVTLARPDPSG